MAVRKDCSSAAENEFSLRALCALARGLGFRFLRTPAAGVDRILPGFSRNLRAGVVNMFFDFREGWTAIVQPAMADFGKRYGAEA